MQVDLKGRKELDAFAAVVVCEYVSSKDEIKLPASSRSYYVASLAPFQPRPHSLQQDEWYVECM